MLPTSSDGNAPSTNEILALLDEKVDTPGWKWFSPAPPESVSKAGASLPPTEHAEKQTYPKIAAANPEAFVSSLTRALKAVIAAEPEITQMDNIAGDGDCGLTLKAGAEGGWIHSFSCRITHCVVGVLKEIEAGRISGTDVIGSTLAIATQTEEQMGGTSGALYS